MPRSLRVQNDQHRPDRAPSRNVYASVAAFLVAVSLALIFVRLDGQLVAALLLLGVLCAVGSVMSRG